LLLRQLKHPNIIGIEHWAFANDDSESHPYLELEYFQGQSLQTYVQQHGVLSPEEVLVLARLLAEALHAAHQQNILHRDLKPANILVRKEAEANWQLKLIDFGLGIRQQTHHGQTLLGHSLTGTFDYAPPEQKGEIKAAIRTYSDVYSFGRTLYYALFQTPHPLPRQWLSLKEHGLLKILDACLEPDPKNRWQDFATVLAALNNQGKVANLDSTTANIPQVHSTFRDTLSGGSLAPLMTVIPAGRFQMGDLHGDGHEDEHPVHAVEITQPFALAVNPVTFEEYEQFIRATGKELPNDEGWGRDTRPVINVSWFDAMVYCEWLSKHTGHEYRLPTEAEWEYAARAGTSDKYCFGNDGERLKDYAWYTENAGGKTQPVGKKEANAWGLYDMHGNVWEWTASSWKDRYEGQESQFLGKNNANNDSPIVLRGGSWLNEARGLRVSCRDNWDASGRGDFVGFRPARLF